MAGTVSVACKLPSGIILRGFNKVSQQVPVLGMPDKMESRDHFVPNGKQAVIKGNAFSPMTGPRGHMSGGYALTHGVDADLWASWLQANADSDYVKNNLVFAHAKRDDAVAEAKKMRTVKSGMEPLDMSTTIVKGKIVTVDQRIPRRKDGRSAIFKENQKVEDEE
jgi:hypothetical protein